MGMQEKSVQTVLRKEGYTLLGTDLQRLKRSLSVYKDYENGLTRDEVLKKYGFGQRTFYRIIRKMEQYTRRELDTLYQEVGLK